MLVRIAIVLSDPSHHRLLPFRAQIARVNALASRRNIKQGLAKRLDKVRPASEAGITRRTCLSSTSSSRLLVRMSMLSCIRFPRAALTFLAPVCPVQRAADNVKTLNKVDERIAQLTEQRRTPEGRAALDKYKGSPIDPDAGAGPSAVHRPFSLVSSLPPLPPARTRTG